MFGFSALISERNNIFANCFCKIVRNSKNVKHHYSLKLQNVLLQSVSTLLFESFKCFWIREKKLFPGRVITNML